MELSTLQQPLQNTDDGSSVPRTTGYRDPASAILSMYITRVQKFEDENVENWKGGAEGILVFTGLFSSTVATFIALSYPNLQQDPNVTTQALLAQISQQLSNSTTTVGPSVQSSYVPPTSVVFINSVWFLSLVLSLTCALMATLLQQWARRYLHIIQRKYAPLHHTRIHEFFSQGARRFGIFGVVETLPLLLLLSVFLFFAGLVVFAFRGNATVAYFTVGIVGFCAISYIAFTLMPLIFHDCPYQTPLTSVLWFFSRIIRLSIFSVLYHGAKYLHERWGTVGLRMVKSFRDRQEKVKSLSETIISRLENSGGYILVDVYKKPLVRMLHWLNDDHELEEFVAGIPGLYWSDALATRNDNVAQRAMSEALATLPGPTSFHASLSWSIVHLAQRVVAGNPSDSIQQQRTRACLKALYCIPGAIRDVLAPYVVGKYYCLEILPLLNSPESLEIIDELWDTPIREIALSVRCAAAVVTAFIITPPRCVLDNFVTPNVGFIGDNSAGRRFLAKRLRFSPFAPGTVSRDGPPLNDTTRLQNLVRFLADIKDILRLMHVDGWASNNADPICQERQTLFDARHTARYRTGHSMFDLQGDRTSPAFIPAAQLDLITLTLEILAQDPVADAAMSQRDAFRGAYDDLVQVTSSQSWWARGVEWMHTRESSQARPLRQIPAQVPPGIELKPLSRTQDTDSVVAHALEHILTSLGLETDMDSAPPPLRSMDPNDRYLW